MITKLKSIFMILRILFRFISIKYTVTKFFYIYLARFFLFTILFVSASTCGFSQIVEGVVRDIESYEPLVGATVFVEEIQDGAVTNTQGFFSFDSQKQDSLRIIVRYLGYTTLDTSLSISSGRLLLELFLKASEGIILPTSEVIGSKILRGEQLSKVSIPLEQLNSIPALLGEADPIKALSLLPGIATGAEGSSGLYIRGGTPDQNLMLFDGAKIYNTSHLFGFLSPFNPDIIKSIDVYKDGFPAHFGGRLSSIIDITGLSGNKGKFQGNYTLGLISSKLNLQGPIKKGKLSYLFGGRFANLGLFTALGKWQFNMGNRNEYQSYLFYDLNGKINYQTSNSVLTLSYYDGKDNWGIAERLSQGEFKTNIDWGNRTVSINYSMFPGNGVFINGSAAYNLYKYGIREEQKIKEGLNKSFNSESYVEEIAIKLRADIPLSKHQLSVGYEGGILEAQPRRLSFSENIPITLEEGSFLPSSVQNHNAFVEVRFSWEKFRLVSGLRWAWYNAENEEFSFLEPRLSLYYYLDELSTIRASYTEMNQPIHLLSTTSTGVPSDIWVLATRDIPPQSGNQFSLGYEKNISRSILFATQLFFKNYTRLIDYRRGVNFFLPGDGEIINQIVQNGEGKSFGLELLIRKKMGKLTGWMAYTLSSSQVKFKEINAGKWYNRRYDRPHDFSATLAYQLTEKWSFATNFIFQSGFMYTLPEAAHLDIGNNRVTFFYGDRNNYRAPNYLRTDVSAVKKWKNDKGKQISLSFGIYNVFARRNPYYIQADFGGIYQENENTGIRDLIGVEPRIIQKSFLNFLPYVSYSREF